MLKISLIMHRPDCKSSLGVLFGILLQPAHPKLENIEPEIEILRKTSQIFLQIFTTWLDP